MAFNVGVNYVDTFEITIMHPRDGTPIVDPDVDAGESGEENQFKVTLRSPKTKTMRIFNDEQADRLALKNAKENRKYTPQNELRNMISERLAASHVSWKNPPLVSDDGSPVIPNKGSLMKLFKEQDENGAFVNDWYRDQIAEALGEQKNLVTQVGILT